MLGHVVVLFLVFGGTLTILQSGGGAWQAALLRGAARA